MDLLAGGALNGDVDDDYGHGTHVAGIIGAVGNSGFGVCGVAWQVKLMSCKALDENGSGSISTIVQAIDFAVANGAQVINNSYGINAPTSAPLFSMQEAIAAARTKGIIFVVAAGNSEVDNDQIANSPSFPAAFSLSYDNVVSVAATNRADGLSFYSNYGLASVALGAPGDDITSTYFLSDSSYISFSGTSMATPFVSGAFALMAAQFPADSYLELSNRVFANTDPVPGLQGMCRTGGRLNLYKALASTSSAPINDNFASATPIAVTPFVVTGCNVDATKETGEPDIAGNPGGKSVWWSWTAPSSGAVFLTTSGSTFNTLLGVYTGASVSQLAAVATSDQSSLTFNAVGGTLYYFTVDGVNGASGSIILSLGYPPSNDDFANAIVITAIPSVQNGTNVNATTEPGEPRPAGAYGGHSVWWQWTPSASTRVALSTEDSTFQTILAVYTGSSLTNLAEVASNIEEDPINGPTSSYVEFDAVAGTAYRIDVDGYAGATGQIYLHLLPITTTVKLFATTPWASQTGPVNGIFTVTRTGSTANALVVNYHVFTAYDGVSTGNWLAVNGTDFATLPGTVTIPAGASSATITVVPINSGLYEGSTEDVALEVLSSPNYRVGPQFEDVVHIQSSNKFAVTKALAVTPNPAYTDGSVAFNFTVNSSHAFYAWDFGDGTTSTNSNPSHAYLSAGTYTATVTAAFETDNGTSGPTLTENVLVQVNPALNLNVKALLVDLNFAKDNASSQGAGYDSLSLSGSLALPLGFMPKEAIVQIDVDLNGANTALNGATPASVLFTLNKSGSGTSGHSSFKLSPAKTGGIAQFTARLAELDLADVLGDQGLVDSTLKNLMVSIPIAISLNQTVYYTDAPASYTAKANKKGEAKGPVKAVKPAK